MTDRKRNPEMIVRFNSGEMTPGEREQFIQLMEKNPRLRDEVILDKELDIILADENLLDLRKKLLSAANRSVERRKRALFLMAAGMIVLAVPAIYFCLQKGTKDTKSTLQPEKHYVSQNAEPALSTPKKEIRSLTEFAPYPPYEALTGHNLRASGIEISKPADNERFHVNSKISFEWKNNNREIIIIKICDNHGKEILDLKSSENSADIQPGKMKRGLYYFMVIADDETVYVGKFMVE